MKFLRKLDKSYLAAINWATSSKGAMYILTCAIWTAVALNPPKTIYEWLIVIVSVYYQGVALPGLGYQQKGEGLETRQLMIDIHEENLEELNETKQMMVEVKEMHQELTEILTELKEK